MTWRMPLDKYKLGTKFGVKDAAHPNGHRGTDYNGFPAGTPLKAVNNFTVVTNKWSGVLGWVIEIETAPGSVFGYCHMRTQSPLKVGHKGKSGDVVGQAGTTGSASSGVHLHLTLGKKPGSAFAGDVRDAHKYITAQITKAKEKNAPQKQDTTQTT